MSSSKSNTDSSASESTAPKDAAASSSGSQDEKKPPRTGLKRPHSSPSNEAEDEDGGAEVDNIYSLEEIIEADKASEEMVGAVLGASDAVNCSYDQGYVYRQALYGCATCLNEMKSKKKTGDQGDVDELLHGICLACSYKCHANHELYELYTKRHFRCDCGNFKFHGIELVCKLKPDKEPTNGQNKYNHNFEGLYCTCNKPYPGDLSTSSSNPPGEAGEVVVAATTSSAAADASQNEEDAEEMEMYQCCICEDWFHAAHLPGYESFLDEEIDDIVCHLCMEKNQFLNHYQGAIPQKLAGKVSSPSEVVDVETPSTPEDREPACLLERVKRHGLVDEAQRFSQTKACCFAKDWRNRLCRCASCLGLYKEKGVEFLLDKTDIISYYEKKGKEEMVELENKVYNDQLSQMNRVSQIEFLHNLNEFKTELTDFLNEFARNGEVCKRENVMKFFEDLNERKRRKVETGSGGGSYDYFCK